jgi:hypothetical protein
MMMLLSKNTRASKGVSEGAAGKLLIYGARLRWSLLLMPQFFLMCLIKITVATNNETGRAQVLPLKNTTRTFNDRGYQPKAKDAVELNQDSETITFVTRCKARLIEAYNHAEQNGHNNLNNQEYDKTLVPSLKETSSSQVVESLEAQDHCGSNQNEVDVLTQQHHGQSRSTTNKPKEML